jgi:hypothetical protein
MLQDDRDIWQNLSVDYRLGEAMYQCEIPEFENCAMKT